MYAFRMAYALFTKKGNKALNFVVMSTAALDEERFADWLELNGGWVCMSASPVPFKFSKATGTHGSHGSRSAGRRITANDTSLLVRVIEWIHGCVH